MEFSATGRPRLPPSTPTPSPPRSGEGFESRRVSSPGSPLWDQQDWRDELRAVLSNSFHAQHRELRELCQLMQHDAKDEIRRFLSAQPAVPPPMNVQWAPVPLRASAFANNGRPHTPEMPAPLLAYSKNEQPQNGQRMLRFAGEEEGEQLAAGPPGIVNQVAVLQIGQTPNGALARRSALVRLSAGSNKRVSKAVAFKTDLEDDDESLETVRLATLERRSKVSTIHSDGSMTSWAEISEEDEPIPTTTRKSALAFTNAFFRTDMPKEIAGHPKLSMQSSRSNSSQMRGSQASYSSFASSNESVHMPSRRSLVNRVQIRLEKSNQRQRLLNKIRRLEFAPIDKVTLRRAKAIRHNGICLPCIAAVANIVNSHLFDYMMGSLLLLNAFILGVSVDYVARNGLVEAPPRYRKAENAFMVVFTVELMMRVIAFGVKFFTVEGWRWNVFDLFIITFGWVALLVEGYAEGNFVLANANFVRLIKLGRITRLARMVRLIPELKSMVYLISASMSSFFWTLVLMLLVIFCMGVYFTELASDMLHNKNGDTSLIEKHWGNLGQSILTLFMSITGGDDWRNFVEPFWNGDRFMMLSTAIIFALFVAFISLVMLNLVTGVFVEGAQRIIREDLDTELMNMAAKVFMETDSDNSQAITSDEWDEQLQKGNLDEYIRAVGITRIEAQELFELLDQDESGAVNVVEFVRGCLRLRGGAKAMDVAIALHKMKLQFGDIQQQLENLHATIQSQAAAAAADSCGHHQMSYPTSPYVDGIGAATEECLV